MDAEEALEEANSGYAFHCWNTYREAPRKVDQGNDTYRKNRAVSGLCLYKENKGDEITPKTGGFTLNQKVGTGWSPVVEFYVNPQFADAMAVKSATGTLEIEEAIDATSKEKNNIPGTTEENPYQVRCGMQLQDINWYDTAYTDVPVGYVDYKVYRFPYLSGPGYTREFYWKQTHDIDWVKERVSYNYNGDGLGNDDGVFFPIAQSFVNEGKSNSGDSTDNFSEMFLGWFGGTYDGGNYTLKNFSIGLNTYVYQINCMGLFGVTNKATLRNIVMYSETGNDVVTVYGRNWLKRADGGAGDDAARLKSRLDGWYAGGVLAGLAWNTNITNCAVAGYTIKDVTPAVRYTEKEEKKQGGGQGKPKVEYTYPTDMGGAIGGLVGITNGKLEGCTASTAIEITCDHNKVTDRNSYRNNYKADEQTAERAAPVRVGGLVGSTVSTVTNCYTGGTITVDGAKNATVYAGRIIGGVGTEPVNGSVGSASIARVTQCYSYLTLPKAQTADNGNNQVAVSVYNIGGPGRASGGTTPGMSTNYYLTGTGGDTTTAGTQVTYQQLEGSTPVTGNQDIYNLLGTAFHKVSNTINGLAAPGRFSFVPSNAENAHLQGLDYPFPTVLTMAGSNVHYGAWNATGIKRASGGAPVTLDVFSEKTLTETLELSGLGGGGSWTAASGDETVVTVSPVTGTGNTFALTYTAAGASSTPVTVTVTYTESGVTYTLPVTVYVTDVVSLTPGTAGLFPGGEVTLEMKALGRDDSELMGGILEVTSVTGESGAVTGEPHTEDGRKNQITLRREADDDAAGSARLTVTYTYTKDGCEKTGIHSINITRLALPEAQWSDDGTTWTMDFGADIKISGAPELWENADTQLFKTAAAVSSVTLTRVSETTPIPADAALTVKLTVDGLTQTVKVPVRAPAAAAADVPAAEPASQEAADAPAAEAAPREETPAAPPAEEDAP